MRHRESHVDDFQRHNNHGIPSCELTYWLYTILMELTQYMDIHTINATDTLDMESLRMTSLHRAILLISSTFRSIYRRRANLPQAQLESISANTITTVLTINFVTRSITRWVNLWIHNNPEAYLGYREASCTPLSFIYAGQSQQPLLEHDYRDTTLRSTAKIVLVKGQESCNFQSYNSLLAAVFSEACR